MVKTPVILLAAVVVIVVAIAGVYVATQGPAVVTTTTATTTATTTSTSITTTTIQEEKIKVGVVNWDFHESNSWDYASYASLTTLQESRGDVEIGLSEGVGLADANNIFALRAQNDDIVWAHSASYGQNVIDTAPSYPDTIFLQDFYYYPGENYFPANVIVSRMQNLSEATYVMGVIAGEMTTSNHVGYIQTITDPFETIVANAYRDGVWSVNPAITVDRIVVGSYVDPVKSRDAVRSFVEMGCDVVYSGMDDFAPFLESEAQGIYCLGPYVDYPALYPNTAIGGTVWDWSKALYEIVSAVKAGNQEQFIADHPQMLLTMADGYIQVSIGQVVPAEIKTVINDILEQVRTGQLVVEAKTEW